MVAPTQSRELPGPQACGRLHHRYASHIKIDVYCVHQMQTRAWYPNSNSCSMAESMLDASSIEQNIVVLIGSKPMLWKMLELLLHHRWIMSSRLRSVTASILDAGRFCLVKFRYFCQPKPTSVLVSSGCRNFNVPLFQSWTLLNRHCWKCET